MKTTASMPDLKKAAAGSGETVLRGRAARTQAQAASGTHVSKKERPNMTP